tara:strand:- start:256 stop:1290 length:1035 start_codon:yes stop_codon:yes gene_type:complete
MAAYTTVNDAGSFYNTILYTGTGSAGQAQTGVGFAPDWVWMKARNTTQAYGVFDTVRGVDNILYTNNDSGEAADANSLTAFGSDGFTVGSSGKTGASASNYAAWNWMAGTTTGLSGGDITPSAYSINTTSGFGIYKYTGNGSSTQTIAHGLGDVPAMMIIKGTGAYSWIVYHKAIGNTKKLILNTDVAPATDANVWQDTTPTSTVFTLGNSSEVNNNTSGYIAYVFAEKQGYSKMGSYTGNSNADGTFVYTGFRPAFVLIKGDSGINWNILDTQRPSYNPADPPLWPNSNVGQVDPYPIDILSNGFKARTTSSQNNASGSSPYSYTAFAESPFVNSSGVPTNAR